MGRCCCCSMVISLAKAILAWNNLVIVTSCDEKHKTIDCCVGQSIIVGPLQSRVSWRVGASQVWWQSSARSLCFAQWCTDTMFLLSLLWSTPLIVTRRNHVNVASRNDNTKVFYQRICCDGSCRENSFIAGAMTHHCNGERSWLAWSILQQALWCLCNRWRSWLSRSLWRGAHHCLARHTRP